MSTDSQETIVALLVRDIQQLKTHQADQDKLIEEMQAERNNALKWGITVLGSMVIGMGIWIVNLAKDHWK